MPESSNRVEVVYGVDIGVYSYAHHQKTGHRAQGNTTFAWARLPVSGPEAASVGNDLPVLAEAIAGDLAAKRTIALGFEAPMWFPLGPFRTEAVQEPPGGLHRLFEARFAAECDPESGDGYQWYKQSGAAASMKAMVHGVMLFRQLNEMGLSPRLVVRESDVDDMPSIVLYEGFVATTQTKGLCKNAAAALMPGKRLNDHKRDAVGVALAWIYRGAPHADLGIRGESLWPAEPDPEPDVVSVWEVIARRAVAWPTDLIANRTCEVVQPVRG